MPHGHLSGNLRSHKVKSITSTIGTPGEPLSVAENFKRHCLIEGCFSAMTTDQITLFLLLAITIALLIWGRWRYDIVAFSALVAAVVVGVVPAEKAFDGFGHPATVIIALVLIISRGLSNSGVVELVARRVVDARRPLWKHIGIMSGVAASLSAVMNNVAALALLMPVDLQAAQKAKRSPALSLMPISFATLLGGLVTLIGTPPNIIISSFREQAVGAPFGMFDFTPVGAACAIAGILFITTAGWRLIPAARAGHDQPKELFVLDDYITEVKVPEGSGAIGKRVRDLDEIAEKTETAILGLFRRDKRLPGQARWQDIRKGDTLVVEGSPKAIEELVGELGLTYVSSKSGKRQLQTSDLGFLEVVVPEGARIEGRSAITLRLLSRHGIALLGVSRQGQRFGERVRRLRIRAGDILLLYGPVERLPAVASWLGALPLAGRHMRVTQREKAGIAAGIFALAIVLSTAGLVHLPVALGATCIAYVALNIVPVRELYDSIEWPVIILLASLLPIGAALESSGATTLVAWQVVKLAHGASPVFVLLAVMVVTMTLSDLLNNAATAVIAAPLAMDIAARLNASPDAFLMGVAISSSCAFLTPIGHKNNTLIMGPGGYKFGDYWRMGLPLEILILVVALPMIMLVWPL